MTEAGGPIVVDASVAIAMIRLEPAAPALRPILLSSDVAGRHILVPDGFWIELANVLIRRYALTPEEVVEATREIDELGVESVRIDRALFLSVMDHQHRHRLSAYDATYLALAEAEDARLLTLDVKLAAAAGDRAIRLDAAPPRRLSEGATEYGRDPVDWARFGPYLAQLRADAITGAR